MRTAAVYYLREGDKGSTLFKDGREGKVQETSLPTMVRFIPTSMEEGRREIFTLLRKKRKEKEKKRKEKKRKEKER